VVAFALLDGDSLLSGVGFDIRLSFGLWCSAVSTVPIALAVSTGLHWCVGVGVKCGIFVWLRGCCLDCYCRDGVCVGQAGLMIFGVRAPIWVSVDLCVVLVYFISCDVLVCVRITHCARLTLSCDINKI
jgi:hypothetical protein